MNLQTKKTKSSFYVTNNEVSIFISADFCVQVYLYIQENEYVIKTFVIYLPEPNKSSIISCIKVIQNTLYCFAYVKSENSTLSELFLYNLNNITENHQNLQQAQYFINANIKINAQIRYFDITEYLIGAITESNQIYVYDINRGTQQFEKSFEKKHKHVIDISGYHTLGANVFVLIADDTVIMINKSYNITEVIPHEQNIIKNKKPDNEFMYVSVQTNNTDIILVNNDGKIIELSEDGMVQRWQNIQETKLQAISSFMITKNDSHYEDQKKYKLLQIITFNNGIIKVNNIETFRYMGKLDAGKIFSIIQDQSIVNCYLFQEKIIIITEKCGIMVLKYIYDSKDKITQAKFQANYQGIYCNDIQFESNRAIGQQDQLLYIQALNNNTLTIHEHMVTKYQIIRINGDFIFTLHLLKQCVEKNVCNPMYNISSDNILGGQYCVSKYSIEQKMYQYFVKIPYGNEQITNIKSHITTEQQELLVLHTDKKHLIVLLSIPSETRHVCYIIPNLLVKHYDVTYDYVKQYYTIVYISLNDELMCIQFTIQDFIKQSFKQRLLYKYNNLDQIFYFKFYKDLLILGLILIEKQSNALQSKVQVYHIKQLQKMNKLNTNKSDNTPQNTIQPLDELRLNDTYNYDALPIGMEINEFTDYTTCIFLVKYKKCTKLYSLICKESLQTLYQIGNYYLTTDYFIIVMNDSYHVFKIDESLLQKTTFFTYLYTDIAPQEDETKQLEYQQIVQDMIEHMTRGQESYQPTSAVSERPKSIGPGLNELRSRLTDRQSSVIASQLRPEQQEENSQLNIRSNVGEQNSNNAMKTDDLVINNKEEASNDSLSYKPDNVIEKQTKSKKQKQEKKKKQFKSKQKRQEKQEESQQCHSQIQVTYLDNIPLDKLRQAVSNTIRTKFIDSAFQSNLSSEPKSANIIANSMEDIYKRSRLVGLPERCFSEAQLNNQIIKSPSAQDVKINEKEEDNDIFQRVSQNIEYESLLDSEQLSFQSDGQIEFNNEQLSLQLKQSLDALDEQDQKRNPELINNQDTKEADEHLIESKTLEISKQNDIIQEKSEQSKKSNENDKNITDDTESSLRTESIYTLNEDNEENQSSNKNSKDAVLQQQSNSTPAQLNQSMSLQLLNGLQIINQSLQQTVKRYEISQDGINDADLEHNKQLIKKEVDLLSNTLERINLLLGIESEDSVKNQLRNLTMTIMGLTKK